MGTAGDDPKVFEAKIQVFVIFTWVLSFVVRKGFENVPLLSSGYNFEGGRGDTCFGVAKIQGYVNFACYKTGGH